MLESVGRGSKIDVRHILPKIFKEENVFMLVGGKLTDF